MSPGFESESIIKQENLQIQSSNSSKLIVVEQELDLT